MLNRLLLAAGIGIWLGFVLLRFTPIADGIIAAIGLTFAVCAYLFPSIKNIHTQRWFNGTLITMALTVLCTIGVVVDYGLITSNEPQLDTRVSIAPTETAKPSSIPPTNTLKPSDSPAPPTPTPTPPTPEPTTPVPMATTSVPTEEPINPTSIPTAVTSTTIVQSLSPTNTPPGTILDVGKAWHTDGLELQLESATLDGNALYLDWRLTNNTGGPLAVEFYVDNFVVVDNSGNRIRVSFSRGSGKCASPYRKIMKSGESIINLDYCKAPLKIAIDIEDRALTKFTVRAVNIGRITEAVWEVPVNIH
jgi:hypothetical protein